MTRNDEIQYKLGLMRAELQRCAAAALHLKGSDWYFWATAGGDNTVLMTNEVGIAELLVTADGAWILTDEIEAERLKIEQDVPGFEWHTRPWTDQNNLTVFIRAQSGGGKILCDRPDQGEVALDTLLQQQRVALTMPEQSRYKKIGLLASQAMTEVLSQAKANWTELELAGAAAECLWARGLQPALILAAGTARLTRYRHPIATKERLATAAMLVFCARGFGLYANLTRFINFATPNSEAIRQQQRVYEVEAIVLAASQANTPLREIYTLLSETYARIGKLNGIREHHQGGLTGYLAREAIAQPSSQFSLKAHSAVAWNPSLAGAKVEDTFLITADGSLENLTFDRAWPHLEINGRKRPLAWQA